MTGIHVLLDELSSGQPRAAVSVDDLVRAGRRRQRSLASGVAAGVAGIVAVAALGTSGVLDPHHAPVASGVREVALMIPAAHIFSGGTSVGTYLETMACATSPQLTVVSEDARDVVVSLTVQGYGQRGTGTWLQSGASASPTCGPYPSSGTADEFHGPTFDDEVTAGLATPLGSRVLIDAATGRTIPYTSDARVAEPTWLPEGWGDDSALHPTGPLSWAHYWKLGSSTEQLSLVQTQQKTGSLGGSPNARVGTSRARIDITKATMDITWFANGWQYKLSDAQTTVCRLDAETGRIATCSPAVVAPRHLTQVDLLHIAASVTPR